MHRWDDTSEIKEQVVDQIRCKVCKQMNILSLKETECSKIEVDLDCVFCQTPLGGFINPNPTGGLKSDNKTAIYDRYRMEYLGQYKND